MSKSIKLALVAIALGVVGLFAAIATTSNVYADAGSGSAVVAPAPLPSDSLANPVDDPIEAYSDLKAAKKQGWALGILAAFIMLAAAVGRAATKWPSWPVLSWINQHKKVLIVSAAIGVTATAVFNALALGGSWFAAIAAGGGALLAFINAAPSEAK